MRHVLFLSPRLPIKINVGRRSRRRQQQTGADRQSSLRGVRPCICVLEIKLNLFVLER